MDNNAFRWFENVVDDGATILNIFLGSSTSESTELVATTANIILSIIRNAGAVKHSKTDFRMLGKYAALLAATVYRLDTLKPGQQEQLCEQLQDAIITLKHIEDFVGSCVQRTGIRYVVSMQADRKMIERHRRKIADMLLRLEASLLTQSALEITDDSRYHLAEGSSFTRGPQSPHRQPVLERTTTGTGSALDDRPSFSVDSPRFSHDDLPQRHRKHGLTYVHGDPPNQCPVHPLHTCIGTQNGTGISNTIIYDFSQHTTHHGSHNFQGQTVNQGGSSHGPENIYMKQSNGNEIHCWTSSSSYDLTSPESPVPDHCINPFEVQDDLYEPEFDDSASGISGASLGQE